MQFSQVIIFRYCCFTDRFALKICGNRPSSRELRKQKHVLPNFGAIDKTISDKQAFIKNWYGGRVVVGGRS